MHSETLAAPSSTPAAGLRAARDALARDELPPGAALVKRSPARSVWRVPLGPGADGAYVKRYRVRGLLDRARASLGRSRAAQEHRGLAWLRARGLPAVEPLGVWEETGAAWLATRELPATRLLREALAEAPDERRRPLLDALAELLAALHAAGGWHRDAHAGNFLVTADGGLAMVDVQKLRVLPGAVPGALRARDLGLLADDLRGLVGDARWRVVERYAERACLEPGALRRAVERAARRRARRRLRSRGRRCVVESSGFRVERRDGRRIFRRADFPAESVAAVLAAGAGREPACVEGVLGGPPPGAPRRPDRRGWGAPEEGAPATGAVRAEAIAEPPLARALGHGRWLPLGRGRRAWLGAHALLLRGFDTPAPLALVEGERCSWLLARHEPELRPAAPDVAQAARRRLRDAGVSWRHDREPEIASRPGGDGVVVAAGPALRFRR